MRHQSPNTIRPRSFPSCWTSWGSVADRKRPARSKNSFCLRLRASIPSSTSSTMMRFALRRRLAAMRRTCRAVSAGRLTVCRTVLGEELMSPLYTTMVHGDRSSKPSVLSRRRLRVTLRTEHWQTAYLILQTEDYGPPVSHLTPSNPSYHSATEPSAWNVNCSITSGSNGCLRASASFTSTPKPGFSGGSQWPCSERRSA
jgi:hypothetical protein